MSFKTPAHPEEIVDPDLPIVDAQHHLIFAPGHRYLLDDYAADIATGHNIRATVYVESRAMVRADDPSPLRYAAETEFANGIAAMSASGQFGPARINAAIVAHADMRMVDHVDALLDAHERAGGGRFAGIRQASLWDHDTSYHRYAASRPPQGLLSDTQFRAGFARLAPRGLAFDAVLFHPQIPELTDLAHAYPQQTIVLNHMGFPLGIGRFEGQRHEVFATWRESMHELSLCGNVLVKLGGLGMPFVGFGFDKRSSPPSSDELATAWAPFVNETITLFGAERCMMESNFPPDAQSCTYDAYWNAMKKLTIQCSDTEKANLFSQVAARTYRIPSTLLEAR